MGVNVTREIMNACCSAMNLPLSELLGTSDVVSDRMEIGLKCSNCYTSLECLLVPGETGAPMSSRGVIDGMHVLEGHSTCILDSTLFSDTVLGSG